MEPILARASETLTSLQVVLVPEDADQASYIHLSISTFLVFRESPVVLAVQVVQADPIRTSVHPRQDVADLQIVNALASQPADPVVRADATGRLSYSDQNMAALEEEEVNHLHLVDLHRSYPCPSETSERLPAGPQAVDRAFHHRHSLVSP